MNDLTAIGERSGIKIPDGNGGIRATSQETKEDWSFGLEGWNGDMNICILSILEFVNSQSVNAGLVCNIVTIK